MTPSNSSSRYRRSAALGAWYGVFVGDALGTTLEFEAKPRQPRQGHELHRDITGGGPFGLEAGDWTDDGAMTLCLAWALAHDAPPEMDLARQLDHYLRWSTNGFGSSNGRCFDIGFQTGEALSDYRRTGETQAPLDVDGQGNGSLMRAVPVPIWAACRAPDQSVPDSVYIQASRTTHNSPVCDAAAVLYSRAIYGAIGGRDVAATLDDAARSLGDLVTEHPALETVGKALRGELPWAEIRPTGWVVHSLAVAFWALRTFDTFEEGMIEVVNLCGDADTNGAIYGGLGGAVHGVEAIPERWRSALKRPEELRAAVEALLAPA